MRELSSVRENLTRELQAELATREQAIVTRQKAVDQLELDLKEKTAQLQKEAERLANQRIRSP